MRPGVAWKGMHAELFEEAMRVVPAIAKHRAAGDPVLVNGTYKAYLDSATDYGLEPADAWSVLASAYSVWLQNLFSLYANECDTDIEETINSAVEAATEWVTQRG
jgi:hypothetical protein